MRGEIYSIYHLSVEPSKFPAFQALIAKIVAATREEPDTLTYEYVANEDKTAVHIVERYRAAGLLPHIDKTFSPFAETFLSLAKIEKLYVYGEPTTEMRTKLDSFGAVYLHPFEGFTRN
jgi:quinol monooxygenase YgiN